MCNWRAQQSRLSGAYAGLTRLRASSTCSRRRRLQQRNRKTAQEGLRARSPLPIFDLGDAVKRAEALYMAALNRTAKLAVDARSQVRERYPGYRTAYDLARHYRDEIVPLRKLIADENLLRYNGMLIGVFELLADAREQIASVNASDRGAARFLDCRRGAAGLALIVRTPMNPAQRRPMTSALPAPAH